MKKNVKVILLILGSLSLLITLVEIHAYFTVESMYPAENLERFHDVIAENKRYYGTASLIGLAVTSFAFYFAFRKKKLKENLIQEKKEERFDNKKIANNEVNEDKIYEVMKKIYGDNFDRREIDAARKKLEMQVTTPKEISTESINFELMTKEKVSVSKQRHVFVTSYLLLMIIGNFIIGARYLLATHSIGDTSKTLLVLLGIFSFVNFIFSILIFEGQKIGFWGIIGTSIIALIINLSNGLGIGQSLLGLVSIAILYGILQIKKDNATTWENLE